MTYKVLKSLVYGGIAYAEGQKVDIIQKSVAENCLERELIAEITDTEVVETEVTGEIDGTEETENNEDTAEEAVSSEENTETEETENNEEEAKPEKTGKRNRNNK
jgi:GTP-binding protein lepA